MHGADCAVVVMAIYTDIYIKVDVIMNGEEDGGHHHVHVYLTFYIKHQKQVLSSILFFFSYKHHGHIKRQYSTQQPAFSRR